MIYIVKLLKDNVCLQYEDWKHASRVFDSVTDNGYDAVLYSFYNGTLREMQRIMHPKHAVGCMS